MTRPILLAMIPTVLAACDHTHPQARASAPEAAATAPPTPGGSDAAALARVEADAGTASPTPAWIDACRAAIAPRFRPSPAWSRPSTVGPADRSGYATCPAWIDGTPPPAKPFPADGCDDTTGAWAGMHTAQSVVAVAVSDDGSTLLRCRNACTFLRTANGHVVARTPPQDADGVPILEKPAVRAKAEKLGFSLNKSSPWPVPGAFVDWSLAPTGSAITYYLRDRTTPAILPIGRFTSKDRYLYPADADWSRNGLALVLEVSVQGSNLVDERDAVVDLPAATALLYLRARELRPDDATSARAEKACAALQRSRDAGADGGGR